MQHCHRSVLAQFRSGILPLCIETGRYNNTPEELRICILCEDNVHVNNDLRTVFFADVKYECATFDLLSTDNKFKLLMSENIVKVTAKFLYNAFQRRRKH